MVTLVGLNVEINVIGATFVLKCELTYEMVLTLKPVTIGTFVFRQAVTNTTFGTVLTYVIATIVGDKYTLVGILILV
jgi:hypothetical protein